MTKMPDTSFAFENADAKNLDYTNQYTIAYD